MGSLGGGDEVGALETKLVKRNESRQWTLATGDEPLLSPDVRGIQRVRAIHAAGLRFSRNRHFVFFSDPLNFAALRLHRYLSRLADRIKRWGGEEGFQVSLSRTEKDGRDVLRIELDAIRYRHTAYLEPDELRWVCEDDQVVAIFQRHGLRDLPGT